jgi:hypothetical protein
MRRKYYHAALAVLTTVICGLAFGGCNRNPTANRGQAQSTTGSGTNNRTQPTPIGLHPGAGNYGMGTTTGKAKSNTTVGTSLGGGQPSSSTTGGGVGAAP